MAHRPAGLRLDLALDQVPQISVKIFEDCDRAVGFILGWADEFYVVGLKRTVVAPEVVGVQEEKDTAAGLISDARGLFGSRGLSEQERRSRGTGRRNQHPTFAGTEVGIFEEMKAKDMGVEGDGLVIVADDDGDVCEGLGHGLPLCHLRGAVLLGECCFCLIGLSQRLRGDA